MSDEKRASLRIIAPTLISSSIVSSEYSDVIISTSEQEITKSLLPIIRIKSKDMLSYVLKYASDTAQSLLTIGNLIRMVKDAIIYLKNRQGKEASKRKMWVTEDFSTKLEAGRLVIDVSIIPVLTRSELISIRNQSQLPKISERKSFYTILTDFDYMIVSYSDLEVTSPIQVRTTAVSRKMGIIAVDFVRMIISYALPMDSDFRNVYISQVSLKKHSE